MTLAAAKRSQPDPRSAVAVSVPRTQVLGVGISAVGPAAATEMVLGWIRDRDRHFVTATGVHGVIEGQDDPAFKRLLNDAGLNVADGMPMVWLSRLAGYTQVSRVFGPDFMLLVSKALARSKGRAFYYGGGPGVAEDLAGTLKRRYPGLGTAGVHCPPFRALSAAEENEVADMINHARPDVVWVGLSTPRQELWMARFRPRLEAPVLIGVGAAFDYNTGGIRRAPAWMQKSGLEWLFRLVQEPKRLWKRYARNNPLFIYYLVCERLGLRDFQAK